MGSLSSHASPSESQDPAPQNSLSNYRVYVSFCSKNPTPSPTRSPNWIERYDPSTNSWELVTSIPELNENNQLKGFAMVTLGSIDDLNHLSAHFRASLHSELSLQPFLTSNQCIAQPLSTPFAVVLGKLHIGVYIVVSHYKAQV